MTDSPALLWIVGGGGMYYGRDSVYYFEVYNVLFYKNLLKDYKPSSPETIMGI